MNDDTADAEDGVEMGEELLHCEEDVDQRADCQLISQQWHEARFILSIKEKYVLSQAAVDAVLFSTAELFSALLDDTLASLRQDLPEEWMQLVQQRLTERRTLFSGLSTSYLQQKYFKEEFQLVVRTSLLL